MKLMQLFLFSCLTTTLVMAMENDENARNIYNRIRSRGADSDIDIIEEFNQEANRNSNESNVIPGVSIASAESNLGANQNTLVYPNAPYNRKAPRRFQNQRNIRRRLAAEFEIEPENKLTRQEQSQQS